MLLSTKSSEKEKNKLSNPESYILIILNRNFLKFCMIPITQMLYIKSIRKVCMIPITQMLYINSIVYF